MGFQSVMSAFDPKRTLYRVTTEQHRPEICGMPGDLRKIHNRTKFSLKYCAATSH
jgi:hypothetical protein